MFHFYRRYKYIYFLLSWSAVAFSSIKKLYYITQYDSAYTACGLRLGYLIHQHIIHTGIVIVDRLWEYCGLFDENYIFRKYIVGWSKRNDVNFISTNTITHNTTFNNVHLSQKRHDDDDVSMRSYTFIVICYILIFWVDPCSEVFTQQ